MVMSHSVIANPGMLVCGNEASVDHAMLGMPAISAVAKINAVISLIRLMITPPGIPVNLIY